MVVITLWTVPRSCSTAFERAFLERDDVIETFHEPRSTPYYYGPDIDRGSTRYSKETCNDDQTQAKVSESIRRSQKDNQDSSKNITFIKDMAYYLNSNLDLDGSGDKPLIDVKLLDECLAVSDVNCFLIRDPRRQVKSLYKMSVFNTARLGPEWNYFDSKDVGYKELGFVFDHITKLAQEQGKEPPVVVDADDVINQPEATLRAFCTKVGIPYDAKMVNWELTEDVVRERFRLWDGWHEHAIASKGLSSEHTTVKDNNEKKKASGKEGEAEENVDEKKKEPELTSIELGIIDSAVQESQSIYDQMYSNRLIPKSL
jgi:hypothetical protein